MTIKAIGEIFSKEQIEKAIQIYQKHGDMSVIPIHSEITEPGIEEINARVGHENDPMYLAYCLLFALANSARESNDQ